MLFIKVFHGSSNTPLGRSSVQCLRSTTCSHTHRSYIRTSKFYVISTTCHILYRHSLTRNPVPTPEHKSRVGCAIFLFRRLQSRVSSQVTSNFWRCRALLGCKIYILPSTSFPVSTLKKAFLRDRKYSHTVLESARTSIASECPFYASLTPDSETN